MAAGASVERNLERVSRCQAQILRMRAHGLGLE
jgi:hypothetical protein